MQMITVVVAALWASLFACVAAHAAQSDAAHAAPPYVGVDSTEAWMSFDGRLELTSSAQPSQSAARRAIESQLRHLIGPMHQGTGGLTAAVRGEYALSDIKIEPKSD